MSILQMKKFRWRFIIDIYQAYLCVQLLVDSVGMREEIKAEVRVIT